MNVRLSVAHLDQEGMVPGFGLTRTTAGLNGSSRLGARLHADASVQYINSDAENRPAQGYGEDNVMWQFMWFGRQVDTGLLRERWDEVLPEGDPNEGLPQNWQRHYWANPYQIQFSGENNDTRNRLIGQVSAGYQLTDWLNATVRTGTDWYEENRRQEYADGSYSVALAGANGALMVRSNGATWLDTDRLLERLRTYDLPGVTLTATNFDPTGEGWVPFKDENVNAVLAGWLDQLNEKQRAVVELRFGLDGAEGMIPALEQIIKRGGQLGMKEIVLGMAHRGRLNVLRHIVGVSIEA